MSDSKLTGQMIKDLRDHLGITQAELAEKLGAAEGTIRNYEKGTRVDKKDGPVIIPKLFDWALSAIYSGLKPFSEIWSKRKEK